MDSELLIVDEFEQMLNTARREILKELGLADRIKPNGIQTTDSDLYVVGLKQHMSMGKTTYYSFSVNPIHALTGPGASFSMDTVREIVRREILKLFPNPATH